MAESGRIRTAHIWFNKLYLKYEKACFTFALKYEETFPQFNIGGRIVLIVLMNSINF